MLCSCRDLSDGFVGISKQAIRDKMDDGLATKATLRDITEALDEMVASGLVIFDLLDIDGLEETVFAATEHGLSELQIPAVSSVVGMTKSDARLEELHQRLYELRSKK